MGRTSRQGRIGEMHPDRGPSRETVGRSEKLLRAILTISRCGTLEQALQPLLNAALDITRADGGGVYWVEGEVAVLRHHRGLPEAFIREVARMPLSPPPVQTVLHQREPVELVDVSSTMRELFQRHGIQHAFAFPLRVRDTVFGFLNVGSTRTKEPARADLLALQVLVTQMEALFSRLHSEVALQESEEYFRAFMNHSPAIAWMKDEQGRYVYLSGTYESRVGRRVADCRGKTDFDLWPHEVADVFWKNDQEVLRTGRVVEVVEEALSPDGGRRYWWNFKFPFADTSGRRFVGGIGVDITERRQLEEDLKRLNERLELQVQIRTEELSNTVDRLQDEVARRVLAEGKLRRHSQMLEAFFQHTISPLAFLDKSFRFVRVNRAYADAYGKHPEFFVGRDYFLLHPETEDRAIFEQVVRTKQPYRDYARLFVNPEDPQRGKTYWNWRLTPLLNEAGEVQTLVLIHEDVTRQENAMEELEHRANQLQRLTLELTEAEERERQRLAEFLHDDLQQMLAAVKFQLSILGGRIQGDDSARETVQYAKEMLKEAIEKSRSLSHELGPTALFRGDLCETFEWLAGQMESRHGLTVEVEVRGLIECHSEPVRRFLCRAAQELLFDVAKHAQVRDAKLRLQRVRDQLWLTISDRGRGFDATSLDKADGYGLLSIRERTELLGGHMKIKSTRGRGSIFFLAIPDAGAGHDSPP
jgi:PAS domain S-box-containing protein